MKIGIVKTIKKEELSKAGEIPPWVDVLLENLNPFIENVGRALQSNLNFADNFSAKEKKLKFESGTEKLLNPESEKLRVSAVIPMSAGGKEVTAFRWVQKTDGNIGITFTFTGGGEAVCELLILLR